MPSRSAQCHQQRHRLFQQAHTTITITTISFREYDARDRRRKAEFLFRRRHGYCRHIFAALLHVSAAHKPLAAAGLAAMIAFDSRTA